MSKRAFVLAVSVAGTCALGAAVAAHADGDLGRVHHIIIVMQENRSFDHYFGALPYVAGSPYHAPHGRGARKGCPPDDHACVDGLRCRVSPAGALTCSNANPSNGRGLVKAFHEPRYCTGPDLEHGWIGSHFEGNFVRPNKMLLSSPNRGFVRVNAETQAPEQALLHDTMGYYTDADLPFYYDLAETFALSDRYFADVIGPTFPNRSYLVAGTSFGHLTTNEIVAAQGYRPITGTLYDRLDAAGVSWTDYFTDLPYSAIFVRTPGHSKPVAEFAADAAAGTLPAVAFIDPSIGPSQPINGALFQTDEHPPADVRAGEWFVSTIVNALRSSPSWEDSILFLTYDEHGGFYDHVAPPPAPQGGASTPDGIAPGQCADLSNPPASTRPGGGDNCRISATQAKGLCSFFTPTGPYPGNCATFDQLGFRLPLVAVSPFAKPHWVSHTVASHASILALIEKRFGLPSLTARDAHADTLEDLFDFDAAPSLNAPVGTAPLPAQPGDPGCPFR